MQPWLMLALAITSELIGETALKAAGGFKRLGPSIVVFVCFILSYVFLSVSILVLPLSIAYAVWSGVGVFATALIGIWLFREHLTRPKILGMVLIVVGTVLLNLFIRGEP
jgi:small multidrug resistance pump